MATAEEIAKALGGSGWEPIKQALMTAYRLGYVNGACDRAMDVSPFPSLDGAFLKQLYQFQENVDAGELPNANP